MMYEWLAWACVKRENEEVWGTLLLQEIDAIESLKQVASTPEDVAPKFASMALKIIGEEVPYKLSQQVPLWSIEDVQYWVTKVMKETKNGI